MLLWEWIFFVVKVDDFEFRVDYVGFFSWDQVFIWEVQDQVFIYELFWPILTGEESFV